MKTRELLRVGTALLIALLLAGTAWADGGVTFTDIAAGGAAGVTYQKVYPPRQAQVAAIIAQSPIPVSQFLPVVRAQQHPNKGKGSAGVALFDFDNDGDLDIYATNGPGADNSLYSNQLQETGLLTFVDVGGPSGAGAFNQDSSGVCAGDIDNDGDTDIYVVATGDPNQLFENQGDGTFIDITATAGVGGSGRNAIGCSMADFDADGRLDIVVGNSYDDWSHRIPVFTRFTPAYPGLEHSYLFINTGGNVFTDASAASGLENVSNMSGPGLTGAAFTWALTTADYDQDGDVDILFADNQGSAGVAAGYLRLYQNDGAANFTEVTFAAGLAIVGGWMGLDFGDFNCDGNLDFFATDLGYLGPAPSRWFLGSSSGTFTDSGAGNLTLTPFGWGASVFDYDNDADADIVYHGGADMLQFLLYDNPGVILQNTGGCNANFTWDIGALNTDHRPRSVQGVAVGDLNGDGFEDIVSISDGDTTTIGGAITALVLTGPTGSPFDPFVALEPVWLGNLNPGFATYWAASARVDSPGTVAVEINSGGNGNGWVQVRTVGSAGISSNGVPVNRDGVGAVVAFTPDGGPTSLRPITAGSSYASQDALEANFGLGSAAQGTVDVLWQGGIRNRLYDVASGEKVTMPHIPCSYDGDWKNFGQYNSCVVHALNDYRNAGVIDSGERTRLHQDAVRAFNETQP